MISVMNRDTSLPPGKHSLPTSSGASVESASTGSGTVSFSSQAATADNIGRTAHQRDAISQYARQSLSRRSNQQRTDSDEGVTILPPDFVPGKWDVICQRGKECFDHVGNRRFRLCIDRNLEEYMTAKNRQMKTMIVSGIIDHVQKGSVKSGGGFIRKDLLTRRWFRVDDKHAREKVGQALRDAIKSRKARAKKVNDAQRTLPSMSATRGGIPLPPSLKPPPTSLQQQHMAARGKDRTALPGDAPTDTSVLSGDFQPLLARTRFVKNSTFGGSDHKKSFVQTKDDATRIQHLGLAKTSSLEQVHCAFDGSMTAVNSLSRAAQSPSSDGNQDNSGMRSVFHSIGNGQASQGVALPSSRTASSSYCFNETASVFSAVDPNAGVKATTDEYPSNDLFSSSSRTANSLPTAQEWQSTRTSQKQREDQLRLQQVIRQAAAVRNVGSPRRHQESIRTMPYNVDLEPTPIDQSFGSISSASQPGFQFPTDTQRENGSIREAAYQSVSGAPPSNAAAESLSRDNKRDSRLLDQSTTFPDTLAANGMSSTAENLERDGMQAILQRGLLMSSPLASLTPDTEERVGAAELTHWSATELNSSLRRQIAFQGGSLLPGSSHPSTSSVEYQHQVRQQQSNDSGARWNSNTSPKWPYEQFGSDIFDENKDSSYGSVNDQNL